MAKKKPTLTAKSTAKSTPAPTGPRYRTVADNRRARFDFEILESIEAGIVLTGTEIKSVRAGRVTIRDAYGQLRDGELWLQNLHVAPWTAAGPWNHEPLRARKLLLHRDQITRFTGQAAQKGLTMVVLRVYIKDHHAKVELALARGRRRYDKRKAIMQRETDRDIARAMRDRTR